VDKYNDFVVLDLEEGLDRQTIKELLLEVARSLAEGYGAGTILLNEHGDQVWPGFWTEYDDDGTIKIPVVKSWSGFRKAAAVEEYAEEYYA
jgi:hypothetical protein